jgi:hypothetical protein
LTIAKSGVRKIKCGGMAEWFKAAVLKTADRKVRGFESYSLRHLLTPLGRSIQIDSLDKALNRP